RIAEGLKRKWENNNQGNNNNNNSHNRGNYQNNNHHNQNNNRRQNNARALTTAQNARQTKPELLLNVTVVEDAILINTLQSVKIMEEWDTRPKTAEARIHLIDIKPIKLNSSYEVELANEKVVSTNSALRGCTLKILDHLFDIDLMPIELGTFNVIVGMDWLVEHNALIVCVKKEVHVPYKNKTLVVKSDSSVSRLKKERAKKQLHDMPVICNFPEVFPNDLPGLPPPRQVEFKIKLIPSAVPVARAPYRLAPSELKELLDQLKELSEEGFIREVGKQQSRQQQQ
nr:putative reverse transcriptase domain-containing protein [Tanacetum cinerariifolium]